MKHSKISGKLHVPLRFVHVAVDIYFIVRKVQGDVRGYDTLTQIFKKLISVNRNVGEGRFPREVAANPGRQRITEIPGHQVSHFTWTTTSLRPQLRAPQGALGVFQNKTSKSGKRRDRKEFSTQTRPRRYVSWSACALGHCLFTSWVLSEESKTEHCQSFCASLDPKCGSERTITGGLHRE